MYLPQGSPEISAIAQSLDSLIRADLQHLRDLYFGWLLFCTLIVGFGLGLEGPEIVHDMIGIFRRETIERRFWLALSIERREWKVPEWMKVMTALGWLLIVVGVTGEFVAEAYIHEADAVLDTFNDILTSEVHKEVASAFVQASSAEKVVAGFGLQIAQADERAKVAKKEAESERLERVKLELQLAPRRLSNKQINKLADKLKPLASKGQKYITITSSAFDVESIDFKRDFETAFTAGGWMPQVTSWLQMNKRGVEIGMLEDPATKQIPSAFVPLVQTVRDAIAGVGVPCEIRPLSPDDPVSL